MRWFVVCLLGTSLLLVVAVKGELHAKPKCGFTMQSDANVVFTSHVNGREPNWAGNVAYV